VVSHLERVFGYAGPVAVVAMNTSEYADRPAAEVASEISTSFPLNAALKRRPTRKRKQALARPRDARAGYAQRPRRGERRGSSWSSRTSSSRYAAGIQDLTKESEPDLHSAAKISEHFWLADMTETPVPPPDCLEHNQPCVRRYSRGRGGQARRAYYVCAQSPRCSFFCWESVHISNRHTELVWLGHGTATGSSGEEAAQLPVPAPPLSNQPHPCNLNQVLQELAPGLQFRDGQVESLQRLSAGESVLLCTPPGSGKSLVFQLHAAISSGTVLVIEPLVSLIRDQMEQLPSWLPAAAIRAEDMDAKAFAALSGAALRGAYKVLYCTPERLLHCRIQELAERLKLAAIVIDEAHCLVEWGHQFRPAYLQIQPFLKRLLSPERQCPLLALTATATPSVRAYLTDVASGSLTCVPSNAPKVIRPNLQFSVSIPVDRYRALVQMLSRQEEWSGPILVYVSRQRDADALAVWLQNHLIDARSYHAGLAPDQRRAVEKAFQQNQCRVVVATVAFGMGIHKPDIRGVIHWTMPSSIEDYVQQTGRAGRDGRAARCHLFYDAAETERMRALVLAQEVDPSAVAKLIRSLVVRKKFSGEQCGANSPETNCFLLLDLNMLEKTLDIPVAVLEHLLVCFSLLTMAGDVSESDKHWKVLEHVPGQLRITVLRQVSSLPEATQTFLKQLYRANEPSATVRASDEQPMDLRLETACQRLSMSPPALLACCARLQCQGILSMQTSGQCLLLHRPNEEPAPKLTQAWTRALIAQRRQIRQGILERMEQMITLVRSLLHVTEAGASISTIQNQLTDWVQCYFRDGQLPADLSRSPAAASTDAAGAEVSPRQALLAADIGALLLSLYRNWAAMSSKEETLPDSVPCTALQITRLLHGIGSPRFPVSTWRKLPFWGKYAHISFTEVRRVVEQTLQRLSAQTSIANPAMLEEAPRP
jgi:RecQ family ATP-dependent DNA helicase